MLSLPDYPVRQRDFLLEISRAITARLDLGEVLRRVLHASVVMTAGRVGIVALRDDDGLFQIRAYTGLNKEQIPELNVKLRELVTDASSGGFDYDYLNNKLEEMAQMIDDSLRQSVAMPLIFADTPLGLLVVFRSYQAEVTHSDVQILRSFADQAAIAVHNAQLYEHINQDRKRLSAILQHSGDGVMILDSHQEILQVNRAFERMLGLSADDAIGLNQDEVLIWETIEGDDLRDALEDGWPYNSDDKRSETFYVEGDVERHDGIAISLGITYAPLFNSSGHLVTIIGNIRDITNFRKAQEMQNIFISTISHELRTPVALIKGYANTLSRDDATWTEDIIRDSLAVIEDEADRLTELIDDLLTASKIQANRGVQLNLADIRLDKLAKEALERQRTQSNNHDFNYSFPDDFPSIQADAKKIRQVMDNLLTNAIKYAPDGGKITLGGRYNEHSVTLFVQDEGAGIPAPEIDKIFDRFYRVDGSLTSKTKGTGLGLYLVKAIIEAHGGKIDVKSQAGHGSTFYFTLPRDNA